MKKFYKHWAESLSDGIGITKRQYRLIKWYCGNEHLLRAESVARQVTGKDLEDLDQVEAHELITYLADYDWRNEKIDEEKLKKEFGGALVYASPENSIVDLRTRALALLATNRVATPGQLGRYIFGIAPETYETIRSRTQPIIEQMLKERLIGCERDFNHPLLGESAKTEIYYLTEEGSDLLHSIAPQTNYHARPGLPSRSRIYHELCVTSVRLDLQSTNNVFSYEPETEIRSQLLKELNRTGKEQTNLKIIENQNWGCGDFRALVVDPHSGKRSQIEVEITIRARQKEITAKPSRITDYYAATLHRCFLIEASQGKLAKIIPDVRIPLTEDELATGRSKPSSIRATISQNRIDRVSAAFEKMGGIGTPGAIAKIAGLKPSTVSEVLFMLAEKGETTYCDGFPPTGKDIGRNMRLYLSKGYTIHSVFDFWRLLTACEVISAGNMNLMNDRPLELICSDMLSGMMVFDTLQKDWPVIVIIDDPSELPERAAIWAERAYKGVRDKRAGDFTREQIIVAVYGRQRAERLRNVSSFSTVNVEKQRIMSDIPTRSKKRKRSKKRCQSNLFERREASKN